MSKKVLTSMKDENPDLQKQIGCISGFFQLFDRHSFLTGQSNSSHNQNIPNNKGGISNHIKEVKNTTQKATANNVKVARENQQFSTESSGTSMTSSSRSSSMSSLEFNRTIQIEPPPINQMKIPENSNSGAAMKQGSQGHQPLDFYDIVKESMHRDVHGLSVKTVAKEEKKGRILKYIDSPRPLEPSKFVNTGVMVAWDSPRLSYDGRDTQDTFKSATKPKELPRLSLDSRQGSIKSFNEGTKSRSLLKGPQKGYGSSSTMQLQEPETSRRPSSVVAKLMGLEAFPDCTETCDTPPRISSCATNKNETTAGPSTNDEYKQHQSAASSQRTIKGSTLLQFRRDASIMNMTPYSRFSLEPIPWRQPEASQGSQLQDSKRSESSAKASKLPLSVYGEIEKRIADLEFKNSGKDLRALKQILDAMQRYKESLDIPRDQLSNSLSDNRSNSSLSESIIVKSPRLRQKDPTSTTVEMSNSTQGSKSPIFIMKPAKAARKTNSPASTEMSFQGKSGPSKFSPANRTNGIMGDKLDRQTAKGIGPAITHATDPISQPFHSVNKSNKKRTSKLMQSSKVRQVINGENATNSSNTAEAKSPRLQKKFGLERRSPPTSPSSDLSSNRRQQNRQSVELSSPSTTPRQKFSEISNQRRDFKHEVDLEVIHIDHSDRINGNTIQLKGINQNNAAEELSKESFMAEKTITAEQPSPVSVLDASFYREEPPSPVKKKSDISKDLDDALNTYDSSEENSEDLPLSSNTTKANFSSDTDLRTQNLVEILQQIDNSDERFTNFRDNKDPDHRYISEILLASGLLSSPSSSQVFHSSSYPINPKLFLALEQIKTNKMCFNIEHNAKNIAGLNSPEQMQRKLIFDVVNDILAQKIVLESSTLWRQPNQQAGRKLSGQLLLDELCTEIDKLQHKNTNVNLADENENLTSLLWEELMHCPTIYTNSYSEIPNVVLDIERLIFKDLITEVVRSELANHSGKHCRQLLLSK
ncbi:Protein LONGIFOLIA 1 [Glycine soja]|uniref:Protein LONGIFOLIA 1 n=1 Tax=Glycine soja TaxID=3848 RepID=A0A445HBP3_GLYSO|nr:protein LONGIFOLIA 1-like [Glycine soja]RZB71037.1 Protein LONGIFOLIA 1 [Glycine soja]